jgi:hypothetical protein
MSNISGNTFFIENSVNCSNLGTLNGQVTFIDCSMNCGQVCNAIFSGAGVCNDGQAYGCTIFCNASNFGYVCGTGILRGSSVLYGSADCVIQCDQSFIDAGASVADYEFLVTTGIPTNIYSDDSAYYVYLSGVSTIACGFYPMSQTNGAFDMGYFLTGSPICSCDVSANGYPSDGIKYINVLNKYICFWGAANNANCSYPYYLLCSPNGHTSIGYFDLAEACGCCAFECINSASVVFAIQTTNYTCSLPILASDNSLYYIYDAATVTIATGLYSNYAINSGAIDCGYFTNTPASGIDCGSHIYENGGAICVTGVNYILDNDCYYYASWAPTQETYYSVESYKTNNLKKSLIAIGDNTTVRVGYNAFGGCCDGFAMVIGNCSFRTSCNDYENCFFIVDSSYNCSSPQPIGNKYFLYCDGSGIVPNGLYSNYAFDNSVLINTTYACTLPQISLDNCCYYVYSSGVAAGASGAYSNYYFEPATSIATTCCIATPTMTLDNCCLYRTYCDGVAIVPQGLSYSNYYICYVDGSIEPQDRPAPSEAQDNIGYYYIYCTGIAILAPPGTYSNFVIDGNSQKLSSCSTNYPTCAIDNGLFYTYFEGGSNGAAAGLYSDHHYTNGCVDTIYTCALPQLTQDNCCYYVYDTGLAIGATGAYSNYYFEPATSIATTCSITTPTIAQDNSIFYTYCDGCAAIVTGCRNDVPGYDASPTGAYDFGNAGENNPVPCFVLYQYGPYIYTYFCNNQPDSATGIVVFSPTYICCGPNAGCVPDARSVWLYSSTISCCGYDPMSLGYDAVGCQTGLFSANSCLLYDCCINETCLKTYSTCSCTNSSFAFINGLTYSCLNGAPLYGCYYICSNYSDCFTCEDLTCPVYADCYCDCYDENMNCIGNYCYCSYVCANLCCGSQTTLCSCYVTDKYVCFEAGTVLRFVENIFCQPWMAAPQYCTVCDISSSSSVYSDKVTSITL